MSGKGSYGTFLGSLKQENAGLSASVGVPFGGTSVIGILKDQAHGSLPLSDLYEKSGMNFGTFSNAVSMFQREGLLDVAGAGGEERVSLTPLALHVQGKSGRSD